MPPAGSDRVRAALAWAGLAAAVLVPLVAASVSPLLAWRDPVYIAAGLAGVVAMALLLVQPLLAGNFLPGLTAQRGRRIHRLIGIALVAAVILHVAALWVTSPPDVIDALRLASPTPFSLWGVIAMWAIFATAMAAALRTRLGLRAWRRIHAGLAAVIVVATVLHALLIQGTMETVSKVALCTLVLGATAAALARLRGQGARPRRRT